MTTPAEVLRQYAVTRERAIWPTSQLFWETVSFDTLGRTKPGSSSAGDTNPCQYPNRTRACSSPLSARSLRGFVPALRSAWSLPAIYFSPNRNAARPAVRPRKTPAAPPAPMGREPGSGGNRTHRGWILNRALPKIGIGRCIPLTEQGGDETDRSRHPCTTAPAVSSGRCTTFEAVGAATLSRSYVAEFDRLLARNRAWLGESAERERASFMMGDTPIQMMAFGEEPTEELESALDTLIAGNIEHPARELMWGSPGTLLAALFLYERTGKRAMVGPVSIDRRQALEPTRVVASASVLLLDATLVWPAVDLSRRCAWLRRHGLAADPRSAPPGYRSMECVGALHRQHRAAHGGSSRRTCQLAPST